MADKKTVQELIDYYSNLLIIQYHNKEKAKATMELFARVLAANGIIFDVRDAYNVDTAVGVQLDVIGQYVGVDRFFSVSDPINYFALTDYLEIDPDAEDKFGFSTYAGWDENQYNGTINYNSLLTVKNRLNDDDYRVVIKLKIIQNNSNHSHKSIDDSMFLFFSGDVIPDSEGGMQMNYFISENISQIIQAALAKNLLPRPMGVGVNFIDLPVGGYFGFASYKDFLTFSIVDGEDNVLEGVDNVIDSSTYIKPNITGFSNYSNYDTKEGEFLTYDKITIG